MQIPTVYKRSLLCAAISLSVAQLSQTSLAQEQTVEEVVVTGSFIRRSEGFTAASQVTQLSAEDLEAEGTMNLGEVIQNLSFVNGASSAITNTIQGTDSRSSTIDLRGLGPRSTLTLLDGKRLANQNVNALIPTIAIQRMDIVADGAAALYGNEAVAGVVNFVPYKSYDGLRVETYVEQDSSGDYDEHSAQFLWGGDIGDLDVVLAGQFRANSRLGWDERPLLANSGLTVSSNSPGNWYVPGRDEDGAYTGTDARTPDPACAPASERDFYQRDTVASPYGMLLGTSCFFDFGDSRSYREPTETNQFFANATWDVSDDLTLNVQGFMTRLAERTYTSTSNPGNSRIAELGQIRGELPGNPFKAMDANGNQLYGVDANGYGIPDRGTLDGNNDGLMDYLIAGTTANGIPLMEDVRPRTLRPINKTNVLPIGHAPDFDNLADSVDKISRFSVDANFTVPFIEGWEGQASYTLNKRDFTFMSNQNYDIEEMKKGLACDVVNDRDACYNPFFVTDASNLTNIHVMNAIAARDAELNYNDRNVLDLVFNGEVPLFGFELPGGPIGAAVGYQYREEFYRNTPSAVELSGDTWIGGTEPETITAGNREVDAMFMELAVPVLSNLEVELAVRREEFSTGQTSTDPKYGITYAPTDWLTLRGTMGDAFIAPSLQELYDPVACGLQDVTDNFSDFSGFTTTCRGGNPYLENETAQTSSAGFDLVFEDWDLHLTWNNTEFVNRIISSTTQQGNDIEFQAFKDWSGFTGLGRLGEKPSADQLAAWVASGLGDPRTIRDPSDLSTILQMGIGFANATSVDITAYDLQGNYRFDLGNMGNLRFNLQATYIDSFMYQVDSTKPTIEAAGGYNDTTGAAPELPQLKANLRAVWLNGNHAVTSTVHYIDDMPYDGPLFTHLDGFANYFRPGGMRTTGVKAWTDMDLTYTYRGLEILGSEAGVSIGMRNAFDRQAQRSPEYAGVIGGLQDPLGRVVFARMQFDL